MARLNGPLMSLDASGSVGGMLTFAKWKGRPYVRQLVIPANPKSDLQKATRAVMAGISKGWAGIDPASQAAWAAQAELLKVSPFNAFVSTGVGNLKYVQGAQLEPEGNADVPPAVPTLVAGDGEIRQVTLTLTRNVDGLSFGMWILKTLADEPNVVVANIRYAPVGVGPFTFVDRDVVPGTTYHYRALGFADSGAIGDLCADQTATPVAG